MYMLYTTIKNTLFIITVSYCLTMSTDTLGLQSDREQPINIGADDVDLDANTGFTHLTGKVEIDQGTLSIRSAEAEVYLEQSNPSQIILRGTPAIWKQQLENGLWMEAEGKTIDYDVKSSTIVITGEALVEHPQGTVNGDKLTYNLNSEHFTGQSDDGGRIRMRLNPDATNDIDVEGIGIDPGLVSDQDPIDNESN